MDKLTSYSVYLAQYFCQQAFEVLTEMVLLLVCVYGLTPKQIQFVWWIDGKSVPNRFLVKYPFSVDQKYFGKKNTNQLKRWHQIPKR